MMNWLNKLGWTIVWIIPLMNPNRDPAQVHAYRMNRGISNLYQILRRGRSASEVNPNGHAQSVSTLRYAFGGMGDASRPHEFMAFHSETEQVDGLEVTTTEIRLAVPERDQQGAKSFRRDLGRYWHRDR